MKGLKDIPGYEGVYRVSKSGASGKIKHSAGFIWKNESCKKPRDK